MSESGSEVATAPLMADARARRPGLLLRTASGAWHVPAGVVFLLRHPRLWVLAALPAIIATGLVVAGLFGGVFAVRTLEVALVPSRANIPDWLNLILTLLLWAGTLGAGMMAGFAVALVLAAPILERLSWKVEALIKGEAPDQTKGLRWEVKQSIRSALYFLAAAPVIFLLGLVPLVGPFLAAFWGAHALSFQQTDPVLTRRGLDFAGRRRWHRERRAESMGFGLAALVVVVPFVSLLVTPALTVGATRFVLEMEGLVLAQRGLHDR